MTAKLLMTTSLALTLATLGCGKKSSSPDNIDIQGQWASEKYELNGKKVDIDTKYVVVVTGSTISMAIVDSNKDDCEDVERPYSVSGNHIGVPTQKFENSKYACRGLDLTVEKIDQDNLRVVDGLGIEGLSVTFKRVTIEESKALMASDGTKSASSSKKSETTTSSSTKQKYDEAAFYSALEGFWQFTSYQTKNGSKITDLAGKVAVVHIKDRTMLTYRNDNEYNTIYQKFILSAPAEYSSSAAYLELLATSGTYKEKPVTAYTRTEYLKNISATEISFNYGIILSGDVENFTKITEADAKVLMKDNAVFKTYFP